MSIFPAVAALLLCQCESTDGTTASRPRIIEEDRVPGIPGMGMGGSKMIYGFSTSTGSGGSHSGWSANPSALSGFGGMGGWR